MADDGSDEMTIDGATGLASSGSSFMDCVLRKGEDVGESVYDPYLDGTSELPTLRRPPTTAKELRRADAPKLSLLVVGEGDGGSSDSGEKDVSKGVPFNISRLRWNASFWVTPVRSSGLGVSNPPIDTRRFLTAALGELSVDGSGEPDRLTEALGLFTLGIRFPYSSRLVLCPPSGGAPRPKLPRGIGTPPLDSNFAILERRLAALPLFGDEGFDVEADWCD